MVDHTGGAERAGVKIRALAGPGAHARQSEGEADMSTYIREIRGSLENLGLVRRTHSSWTGGFLVGTGFGVVAGAAVAALLTPTKGKEMRKLVRSKAKNLASQLHA